VNAEGEARGWVRGQVRRDGSWPRTACSTSGKVWSEGRGVEGGPGGEGIQPGQLAREMGIGRRWYQALERREGEIEDDHAMKARAIRCGLTGRERAKWFSSGYAQGEASGRFTSAGYGRRVRRAVQVEVALDLFRGLWLGNSGDMVEAREAFCRGFEMGWTQGRANWVALGEPVWRLSGSEDRVRWRLS
jgi:hypothetical protein